MGAICCSTQAERGNHWSRHSPSDRHVGARKHRQQSWWRTTSGLLLLQNGRRCLPSSPRKETQERRQACHRRCTACHPRCHLDLLRRAERWCCSACRMLLKVIGASHLGAVAKQRSFSGCCYLGTLVALDLGRPWYSPCCRWSCEPTRFSAMLFSLPSERRWSSASCRFPSEPPAVFGDAYQLARTRPIERRLGKLLERRCMSRRINT